MSGQPKNIGASVRDRLTNRAREQKVNAQLLMTRYVIERLLWRLSVSDHRQYFVLKGAMLFSLWTPVPYRATGDLDLLGFGNNDPEIVAGLFAEVLAIEADDGIIFKPKTIKAAMARPEDHYSGVRLDFEAEIHGARLPIHVDIGFGDAITPGAQDIEYPSLLGFPPPQVRAYPRETVVAEKFQAMTALDMANSRMKDFFDLWAIATTFEFDGAVLAEAIGATFERRDTPLPAEPPTAFTAAFAEAKQAQWAAFIRRTEIAMAPEPFPAIQETIARFVMPPVLALAKGETFARRWPAGGDWAD